MATNQLAQQLQPTERQDALIWIDCEMTGLNPDTESILEIFCLITDGQLELLDRAGWGVVIHHTKERMSRMDEWCTRVHGESGLTAAAINSTVTPEEAADGLLAYIQKHVPEKGAALLAGNSVHADRTFLRMGPYSKVLDHLHYRILDVSSIKEAAGRWWYVDPQHLSLTPRAAISAPRKQGLHKAKDDILESINEAKYYRSAIFQKAEASTH
ncbi:ribonuclease H-like domain-containing protein [Dichotomopilus funicola]|uniref:Ribonuclease H-like domain-containing protein n=1 Tax=Dichotomopilus funicola TaxID=1934379 RepID=A0AAN6V5V9_9PEZI|nr:ribonuclease H-like domain-containing protein [Dichotomopilus funicola]